ncbi:MAG: HlyD family secretion protein [Gammaproteobacteria bacterium]|nr:HlyD family secretion protein [Gammaproteobacteria bacterium]
MDLLLIATYVGICVVVFKVFKIPLNKWSVPTAALGGVFMIAALTLLMNYFHPYAKFAKEVFITTPIVPVVRGPVIAVDVEPNQSVKAGDVLFRIDPIPYELDVVRKRAQLTDVSQGSLAQEEDWRSARAQVESARTARDRSKQSYERYAAASSAYPQKEIEDRRQMYLGAQADLEGAMARERSLKLLIEKAYEGEDASIAQLRAELREAEYKLEHTLVRAPEDGTVTQLAVRPGMMAVSLPAMPLLTFLPDQTREMVGSFWQNSMALIKVGAEAEVILDGVPGHVFSGRVSRVAPAMSEGQIQAGRVGSADLLAKNGRAIAAVTLDEDLDLYGLPRGVQGQIVVYGDDFRHVAIMRRVLLRMVGWLNYVYPVK